MSKESLKNFQSLHNVLFNELIDKQIMLTTKIKMNAAKAPQLDPKKLQVLSKSLDHSPREASICSMLKVVKGKAIEMAPKLLAMKGQEQ